MISRRLKIAIRDHRGESMSLISALHAAGHEFVTDGPADVLFIDLDSPLPFHQELIDRYEACGAKIVVYPHGAGGPILSYDGLFEPDPRVHANLVTGVGQAEYLRRIDYPAETHTIGWTYCDMRPFRPCADVKAVLFAPTHPNAAGTMTDYQRDLNADTFRQLLETPFEITVRHIGTLEQNGLWRARGVEYAQASTAPAIAQIDAADAVVGGSGTFPTLAVARGVPAVVYCQDMAALGLPGEQAITPERMPLYWDYARFPFDVEDGPLEDVVRTAADSEGPVAAWRRRFVGQPFDARSFVERIERLVVDGPGPVRIDPTRRFTTLGFVDEMIERPELLQAYAAAFGPADDASLILWGPAVPGPELLTMAETAIDRAGLDADRLPDMLLAPLPGSPTTDAALSERADAVLTEWPATGRIGELPRFGPADAAALRAAAAPAGAIA